MIFDMATLRWVGEEKGGPSHLVVAASSCWELKRKFFADVFPSLAENPALARL
jgi:hypothetical protein